MHWAPKVKIEPERIPAGVSSTANSHSHYSHPPIAESAGRGVAALGHRGSKGRARFETLLLTGGGRVLGRQLFFRRSSRRQPGVGEHSAMSLEEAVSSYSSGELACSACPRFRVNFLTLPAWYLPAMAEVVHSVPPPVKPVR
jgi:hypothetical protein